MQLLYFSVQDAGSYSGVYTSYTFKPDRKLGRLVYDNYQFSIYEARKTH